MRKLFSIILTLSIFIGTFGICGAFKADVRADVSDPIYVCEEATTDRMYVTYNNEYIKMDEIGMCCDLDKPTPTRDNLLSRQLLSETSLTAEEKSKLVMILLEQDTFKSMISDIAANDQTGMASNYLAAHGSDLYIAQHLMWIVLNRDFFLTYQSPYAYYGISRNAGDTTGDYQAEGSFWNLVFAPLLNYIDSNYANYPVGNTPGAYDSYFYWPDDTSRQRIMGMPWKNKDVMTGNIKITKTFDLPRDLNMSDVEAVKFNVISNKGTIVGTFAATGDGAQATQSRGVYTLNIPVNTTETYTIEEVGGALGNIQRITTYSVNGTSANGSKATGVASGSTVDFVNTYVSENTSCTIEKYFRDKNILSPDELRGIEIDLGKINAAGEKEIVKTLTIGEDFKFDTSKGCYYVVINDLDPDTQYFVVEKNCDYHYYEAEHTFAISYVNGNGEKAKVAETDMIFDDAIGYCTIPQLLGKNNVTKLANTYELLTGTLEIVKTIEGDITDEDKAGLTFTVTDSEGKTVGTYVLGTDFTYDADTDTYKKVLTNVDARKTYTVEETLYTVDGYNVSVTYTIGGDSTDGAKASDVTVKGGNTTTVAFTDCYATPTARPTATPTAAPTTKPTAKPTAKPTTSASATATPAATTAAKPTQAVTSTTTDEDKNVVSSSKDKDTATVVTSDTDSELNTSADSAAATATPTPAPTATTAPTATPTAVPDKTTSRITKTGETISVFAIAGLAFMAMAAGTFTIRAKRTKKEDN